ncbi:hypothetical protein Pa4123_90890 [Phytohabitans aurantiacus]|uniref:Uncharacterized protein n=1 Tax=Phytohabitans aurantiacus TaxID=3016789 RepID=A0ABQ5RAP3_9ACTN|nr:hypothetical protein Pa4123_90890 [Phytohabitans aurantiacus]
MRCRAENSAGCVTRCAPREIRRAGPPAPLWLADQPRATSTADLQLGFRVVRAAVSALKRDVAAAIAPATFANE